jgi:SecD/SecF fusion protein
MNKELRNRLLTIFAVILGAVFCTFPFQKRINLGLDLKGGMHLILRVDTEKLKAEAKNDAVLRAIEILRNRIDGMGVGETVIQRQGESEILVQLPGITDRKQALDIIGRVAQLEFRLVSDDPNQLKEALNNNVPAGYVLKRIKKENEEPVLLEDKVALSGERVVDARVDFNSQGFGEPQIYLTFNSKGAQEFGLLTQKNVGRRLAILLDGEVLSAPNISEPILGGNAQISGQFSFDEASVLALALRSGALPAPMHVEEERTIGPLLGKDSIDAGIKATLIGGALVFAFMIIYYLKAGIIADIALLINLLLVFGLMGFLNLMLPESQATLTLPGIAGIILTLGMAVDANVLINERIREELKLGRSLQMAVNNGFKKALSAIIDSNVTSLIAAFMLFQFGSGPIKGFAVTLSMGLISSMFTAIFVSKTIFLLLLTNKSLKDIKMLSFFKNPNFNFLAGRYIWMAISLVVIGIGMNALIQKKDAAYGIDFSGGQIQEYKFAKPVSADEIRGVLKNIGLGDAIIQQFDQFPGHVMIRTADDTYEKISQTFKESFTNNTVDTLRIEKVGPVVGKHLRKAAMFAIILAMAGILVYVGFRFKHFDFAVGGVVALVHDVLIALGLLVLMGHQIDLLVVTALLTIAGYSINDTIVIYDRVRENMLTMRKQSLAEIINTSLNQTLGRTILTTGATLLVVISLFLYGGQVLNSFALCLLIGFIAGTYSTIFIASPIVLLFQKKT